MKRTLSILLFCLLVMNLKGQSQYRLLKKAYKTNSTEKLDKFFETWHDENVDYINCQNDTNSVIINVTKFLNYYYKSQNGFENKDLEYFVLPSNIKVYVHQIPDTVIELLNSKDSLGVPNLESYITLDNLSYIPFINDTIIEIYELKYFKPEISNGINFLYLTPRYKKLIERFIGKNNINRIFYSYQESAKRASFFDNYFAINYGHWGGLHLCTFPEVNSVSVGFRTNWIMIEVRDNFTVDFKLYIKNGDIWTYSETIMNTTE